MSISTSIARAISAAVARPILLDEDGKIAGVGTTHSLSFVQGEKFKVAIPQGSAAASTNYVDAVAGNGWTVSTPKQEGRVDTDGNPIAATAGGGGGSGGDVVGFTAFDITRALVMDIHEYAGNPWQIGVQIGENITEAEDFTTYLIGTLPEIEFGAQPETFTQYTFDVTGGKAYSLDGTFLDAGLAWAPAAITQPGGAVITLAPLLVGDVAATTYAGSGAAKGLLSGRAVIV